MTGFKVLFSTLTTKTQDISVAMRLVTRYVEPDSGCFTNEKYVVWYNNVIHYSGGLETSDGKKVKKCQGLCAF